MSTDPEGIQFGGSVWLTIGGETLGGIQRIELLAGIEEHGSITRAAKAIGMSYKAAWDAVDTMNQLTGQPLVLRTTGGKGGGGTRLTERGRRLVDNFKLIEREHRRFLAELSQQADGITEDYLLLRRLSMKTSARNQFLGEVSQIKTGAVNDEIELEVAGGHKLVAVVTRESTENLGLKVGAEAFALIKASSIIVITDDEGARFSARNRLAGVISRIQNGAVNTEVVLDLPGGFTVAAIVTNESSTALELAVGKEASVIFKASSVILGTPA
ncbi:TOBE domain-containing protein [Chitiniphilus shinanonensis]|uniref:TOBE domain-containing protein n=1 Tax=Chitiniphilus shinanonensis TaxID=553088 RepID=UPI003040589C